jgi:hypothetical protein
MMWCHTDDSLDRVAQFPRAAGFTPAVFERRSAPHEKPPA